MTLAQVSQVLDSKVVEAAFSVVIGVNVWMLRVVTQTREGVRSLTQAMYGEQGNNGFNGTQKSHAARLENIGERLALAESDITHLSHELPDRRKAARRTADG